MTIGYLHLGSPASGPVRFGRLIARFVAQHTEMDTLEVVVDDGGGPPSWSKLWNAARDLSAADAVHVQYSPRIWGGRRRQVLSIPIFEQALRAPLIATAHDVLTDMPPASGIAVGWLARRSCCVLVSNETERQRLLDLGVTTPVELVPHFVEPRGPFRPAGEAREMLGLEGRRVLTLLGFIHRGKGQDLAVTAMEKLPKETVLVLAGGAVAGGQPYLDRLRHLIADKGLQDRVRITGYLTDSELDLYMAATDVGLLPYRWAAASGAMATWLALGRPLVVTDLPPLREYARWAPDLIRTIPPDDPEALAAAVKEVEPSAAALHQAEVLAERFSPDNTAGRLAGLYRRYAGAGGGGP